MTSILGCKSDQDLILRLFKIIVILSNLILNDSCFTTEAQKTQKKISHLLLQYAFKWENSMIIMPEYPDFPFPHCSDFHVFTRWSSCFLLILVDLLLWLSPPLWPSAAQTACATVFESSHVGSLILSATSGSSCSCLFNSPEKYSSFCCSSLWWTMSCSSIPLFVLLFFQSSQSVMVHIGKILQKKSTK